MKIEWQLTGIFRRISLEPTYKPVELSELISDIQAIASQKHYHSLAYIRSHFGLNILPEKILTNDLLRSRYLIPSLQILYPTYKVPVDLPINYYRYTFSTDEFTLDLNPDDPQLPVWLRSEVIGKYTLIIESSTNPQTQYKWKAVQNWIDNLEAAKFVHYILQSSDLEIIRIQLSPDLAVLFKISELPIHVREVVIALRDQKNISQLSANAQRLITEYSRKFSKNIQADPPATLEVSSTSIVTSILINKKYRQFLEQIINEAEEFLLLSSYRIEDERIANLIAEKAKSLQQGVWILSDYGNRVIDRIDSRVDTGDEYEKSDFNKKKCLKILARSGAYIRSGNFHLKVCISEKQAYLGSCNLTSGSLDFNIEAGIVWSNTLQHKQIIELFSRYWQTLATGRIIPSLNSIVRSTINSEFNIEQNHSNFLSAQEYKHDLINELRNLPKGSDIKIYTYNFEPSATMEELIQFQNYHIYYGNYSKSRLRSNHVNNLHAKVTVLGKRCAYIGGINYTFMPNSNLLYDLMYKISDTKTIVDIQSTFDKFLSNYD